ncbi:MAG: hypothetical protein U0746_22150 [Gemmataceae bacterium]
MRDSPATSPLSPADCRWLDDLYDACRAETSRFIGYPGSAAFDYTPLYHYLAFPLNNVGDPYLPSNYHVNTHDIERDVLATFMRLTHAPADGTWDYVNGGGTEGNMYGDIAGVLAIMKRFALHEYYVHSDAALSGMILPFVDAAPPWDFRAPVDSLSISGHKMSGFRVAVAALFE